jgi:hypothetical protein
MLQSEKYDVVSQFLSWAMTNGIQLAQFVQPSQGQRLERLGRPVEELLDNYFGLPINQPPPPPAKPPESEDSTQFPRSYLNTQATHSSKGPGRVTAIGRGLPCIGLFQEHAYWAVMEDGYIFDPFDAFGSLPHSGSKIHIFRRAISLASVLKFIGINGIEHPDTHAYYMDSECEKDGHIDPSHYALIGSAYCPWGPGIGENYFDDDQCLEDFRDFVVEFFACDPTVKLDFSCVPYGSNEIEITRI